MNHAASSAISKAHDDQQFAELHTFRRLIEHVCDVHDISFDSVSPEAGISRTALDLACMRRRCRCVALLGICVHTHSLIVSTHTHSSS